MKQSDTRMTASEVVARVGRGLSAITKGYKASPPTFPAPHFLGTNRRYWWASRIEKWEETAVTASNEHRSVKNLRPNQAKSVTP